ncbi:MULTISPECIES: hypothetical protein [Methylomicrobium]|uniref:DUF2281 domain-containing protein n=1 Tax=Methylomicrobium album BG8 TaxID=686340 RepID=H8GJ55_METAL|nr:MULTISPECIES: hypothetical protein [Methylomicrobium]EIC31562.1 hypothetical protein Metal_3926 [Methylomicrobium album BG8]
MLLHEQIIEEIKHIPAEKLAEVYDLIHYFRLGLQREKEQQNTARTYPLRGTKIRYSEPTESVALNDWESLR